MYQDVAALPAKATRGDWQRLPTLDNRIGEELLWHDINICDTKPSSIIRQQKQIWIVQALNSVNHCPVGAVRHFTALLAALAFQFKSVFAPRAEKIGDGAVGTMRFD